MKYLKITTRDVVWGKNEITKEDLVKLMKGEIEMIINIEDMTFFYYDKNRWEKIGHD